MKREKMTFRNGILFEEQLKQRNLFFLRNKKCQRKKFQEKTFLT